MMSDFKVSSELSSRLRELIEGAEWYWEVAGVHEAIADNVEIRSLSIENGDVDRVVEAIVLEVLDYYSTKDRIGIELGKIADALDKLANATESGNGFITVQQKN